MLGMLSGMPGAMPGMLGGAIIGLDPIDAIIIISGVMPPGGIMALVLGAIPMGAAPSAGGAPLAFLRNAAGTLISQL
jgi:hypothetical protein